MIEGILVTMLESAAYDIIKRIIAPYLPSDTKEPSDLLIQVIETTAAQFHVIYGEKYGTPSSSFLSIEKNWEIIMSSIFYGNDNLDEHQLELSGLGIDSSEAKIGAREFVHLLKAEMKKHFILDQILTTKDFIKGTSESLMAMHAKIDQFSSIKIPVAYINKAIQDEITTFKKSRYFQEFDTISNVLTLVAKLNTGELSGGSDYIRSWALAWCARFATIQEPEKAREYLEQSKLLGTCDDNVFAEAFIKANDGDLKGALALLNPIDSPLKRSVALKINTQNKEEKSVIEWLKSAGFSYEELDSEGKTYILSRFIRASYWNELPKIVDSINENDLDETPVLYHLVAMSRLVVTVPSELRETVVRQIPFEIARFSLFEDTVSISLRQEAHQYFQKAAELARQLKLYRTETINEEYALWLKLRDPLYTDSGRKELETKLNDPQFRLRLVPFALQFGIKLNLEAVEKEISREVALNGEITQDAALARLALVFTQNTPEKMAIYIEQHLEELSNHVNRQSLQSLQVEMLSKAGLSERANECLGLLIENGISVLEEGRIRRIIAESEGMDPIESRKLQFEDTDSLHDLDALVQALELKEDWLYLCKYGEMLFDRTHAILDAERLARALSKTGKTDKLIGLVKTHNGFLEHSQDIRTMYCWALYREGRLIEARSELSKFNDLDASQNLRILQVNLAISLGDWKSLSAFVANEIRMKEQRNAQDLLGSAQLALYLNLHLHAKELITEAVIKTNDDPQVMASAYFLAVSAGIEENTEISKCLYKAIELSDNEGPLQQVTVHEFLDLKPEWERRETEIWELLRRGKIPLFLAAESLNRTLIKLLLFPAFANQTQNDLRHRVVIPVFSGNVQKRELENIKVIGFDVTALLTLSFLNLLRDTFEVFDEVFIPHSTLVWLFEEQKQVSFHQPSRIEKAKEIQRMLASGEISRFISNSSINSDLADQVGDELAMFVTEAMLVDADHPQKLVIRSYPVTKLVSLMEEDVDLHQYYSVLSSCLSVVHKLREKGEITKEEEKRAVAYLQMNEEPWPHQPEIIDGAVLYLDHLSIHYFQELGFLEKLLMAGFKLFVSSRVIAEVDELIKYESISDKIFNTIEVIRATINEGIISMKVRVGRQTTESSQVGHQETPNPTVELFALASQCDVLVSDDRYFNQHLNIQNGDSLISIISTLDILDILLIKGIISSDGRQEYITKLRRAGYLFISVTEEELFNQLISCVVRDDKVVENAELKAIRESVLRTRMTNWLQLPIEASWLNSVFQTFFVVLKKLWALRINNEDLVIYSDWILDQLDIRGWAHSFEKEAGEQIVKSSRGAFILTLLHPPRGVDEKISEAYWGWIESRVLIPLNEECYELYNWLVDWHEEEITKTVAEKLLSEVNNAEYELVDRSKIILLAFQKITHPMIQQSLLERQSFRKLFELSGDPILSLENENITIKRSKFYEAVRKVLESNSPEIEVMDVDDNVLQLKRTSINDNATNISIFKNNKIINLPDYRAFSNDSTIRLNSIKSNALDTNLPEGSFKYWNGILSNRAFSDDEIDVFHRDIHDTPIFIERLVYTRMGEGQGDLSSLVPPSRRYYERLVGKFKGSKSIIEYAFIEGKDTIKQLLNWSPYNGFLLSLYLSSHSSLTKEIAGNIQFDNEELMKALSFLEGSGDKLSQLGAIEICLESLKHNPEIETVIIRLIKQIIDDAPDSDYSHFTLFSTLFMLVDGELSRLRLFATEPPFYRRLASMAQTSLIHRQLTKLNININDFCEWAIKIRPYYFYFQTLADMRLEPRWNPNLATGHQLKNEFIGRIMNAAHVNKENIPEGLLHDLLFGEKNSIKSLANSVTTYYPGPLEGTGSTLGSMTPEIKQIIEDQLLDEQVSVSTFIGLVNSALIFNIPSTHVEMAIKALEVGNYRLANAEENDQIVAVANGLALTAAVTRSELLSEKVRIFARRHRNDITYALTIDEDIWLCLVSAACYENRDDWVRFVGEWLTEIAFSPLLKEAGERMLFYLDCLCFLVPELWVTCGRAIAALEALTSTKFK